MREITKYKLNAAIRYFGDAFFYPFFALYLINSGLTESKIGFILSITPIIAIIANPIYSHLCQDIKTTRKVLRIITIM
ncbi:MAG: MFS transporter, partial [Bacilli bacterium]|nr:MFS transporter [Bacilli bacterium]